MQKAKTSTRWRKSGRASMPSSTPKLKKEIPKIGENWLLPQQF